MSAPAGIFPNTDQPWAQEARGVVIQERGTLVPGWYVASPHVRPHEIVVTEKGVPLIPRITVDMIAPERRWAVGLDGEIMDQQTFAARKREGVLEWYRLAGARYEGNVQLEYMPKVLAFISQRVDPEDPTRLTPIHYDKYSSAGSVPSFLATSDGETQVPREEALRNADPHTLTASERAEVEAIAEAETSSKTFALCGAEKDSNRARHAHEINCKKCKELRGQVGTDASPAG